MADIERRKTIERIHAGLATARRRGTTLGRPRALDDAGVALAVELHENNHTLREIAEALARAGHTGPKGKPIARGTLWSIIRAASAEALEAIERGAEKPPKNGAAKRAKFKGVPRGA